MIKYFYFILLSFLVSCSSTGIKLVDEYYIYPPDEYYNSYYLKCKLSSDNDPIIDSVHIVYWNDSTIIIERKAKHDNWIINAFDNNLKCCNNDTVVGPVSTSYINQIMTDRDLAELYGVETKRLNEAVKRNIERFPERFRFQLTKEEMAELVANCDRFNSLKRSTVRSYAFTEQGVAMLSTVLRSETAIRVSIRIYQTNWWNESIESNQYAWII